jgi:hypothetical protein
VDTLATKTPCCDRAVRFPFAALSGATQVCRRKRPKCRKPWVVVVRPAQQIRVGVVNVIEWTEQ